MFYSTTEEEIEVLFTNEKGEEDAYYINVQIDVKGKYVDMSFSHEFGVEKRWGWEEIFVKWDKSLYTDGDNVIIQEYVDKYFDELIDYLESPKDSW